MAAKRGRRPKSSQQTQFTWYIEIQDWKQRYSFSLPHKLVSEPGPFSESAIIEAQGVILYPKKFEARSIEIFISADRFITAVLMNPLLRHEKPIGVGELFLRGKQSQFFCTLPFDVHPMITSGLHDGELKYLSLSAEKLRYGQAIVTSVSFVKDVDLESY